MRIFGRGSDISVYSSKWVSMLGYSCLPRSSIELIVFVWMAASRFIHECKQHCSSCLSSDSWLHWRALSALVAIHCSCLSSNWLQLHTVWTGNHVAVMTEVEWQRNQSPVLGLPGRGSAGLPLTFSKFIINLWVYFLYTHTHTHIQTQTPPLLAPPILFSEVPTAHTHETFCVLGICGGGKGGRGVCVVGSPLKLSSVPPCPSCQTLNLEKCQWAQWAGRAGRCVTMVQTDTNTSAALIISNQPKEKKREREGERYWERSRVSDWETPQQHISHNC